MSYHPKLLTQEDEYKMCRLREEGASINELRNIFKVRVSKISSILSKNKIVKGSCKDNEEYAHWYSLDATIHPALRALL